MNSYDLMGCLLILMFMGVASCVKVSDSHHLILDEYHDYDQMTSFLNDFTRLNYNLSRLYTIGRSPQGRELWAVEISAVKNKFLKPNVKLIANMHGNELVGREMLLHLAEYLVEKYKEGDARVRKLLEGARVHLLPSMNPDGASYALLTAEPGSSKSCVGGPGRKNHLGYDLNRNFPDQFHPKSKHGQLETEAIKKWLRDIPFVLSASIHGGALVASYPFDNREDNIWEQFFNSHNTTGLSREEVSELWRKWRPGGGPSPTPDDDVFQHLATVYAEKHPTMHLGEKCHESQDTFTNGITNGAAWYPLTGGMQDYNYLEHGCMEITLEISCCKFPNASELPGFWEENREPLLSFLEEVKSGLRGIVRDVKGVGVPNAKLQIMGRSTFFHTSPDGEFWRILLPQVYYLHVEAEGFESQTLIVNVYPQDAPEHSKIINITLYGLGSLRRGITPQSANLQNTTWLLESSSHKISETSELPMNTLSIPLEARTSSGESASLSRCMLICCLTVVSTGLWWQR